MVFETMGLGGVTTHVLDIIKTNSKQYDFYLAAKDGDFRDELAKYSKAILDVDFYNDDAENIIINANKLSSFIKKNNIDVIHIHPFKPFYPVMLAHFQTGVPYVITIHAFLYPEDNWREAQGEGFVDFWERIIFPYADKFIFVSKQHEKYWLEKFPIIKQKTLVIPNSVIISDYVYNPTFGSKYFMALRLDGDKQQQIDTAIDFIRGLKLRDKDACLDIVGDGNLINHYKEITKNDKTIKFIGKRLDVDSIIGRYDVVMGSGRTALEAIASGKKLIFIGLFGLKGVVTPDNFDKLADVNFCGKGAKEVSVKEAIRQLDYVSKEVLDQNYSKLCELSDPRKIIKVFNAVYSKPEKTSPNLQAFSQLEILLKSKEVSKKEISRLNEVVVSEHSYLNQVEERVQSLLGQVSTVVNENTILEKRFKISLAISAVLILLILCILLIKNT